VIARSDSTDYRKLHTHKQIPKISFRPSFAT